MQSSLFFDFDSFSRWRLLSSVESLPTTSRRLLSKGLRRSVFMLHFSTPCRQFLFRSGSPRCLTNLAHWFVQTPSSLLSSFPPARGAPTHLRSPPVKAFLKPSRRATAVSFTLSFLSGAEGLLRLFLTCGTGGPYFPLSKSRSPPPVFFPTRRALFHAFSPPLACFIRSAFMCSRLLNSLFCF